MMSMFVFPDEKFARRWRLVRDRALGIDERVVVGPDPIERADVAVEHRLLVVRERSEDGVFLRRPGRLARVRRRRSLETCG